MRLDRFTAEMLDAKTRLRDSDLRTLERLWRVYGGLSDADAARFVAEASRVHGAALAAQAQMYASYARVYAMARGLPSPERVQSADIVAATRAGAPLEDRMGRAVVSARTAVSGGAGFTDAMRAGLERLLSVAGTDHQLVHTHAATGAWSGTNLRYQRVLRGPINCALCIAASAGSYKSSRLMPIHPRCDCGVAVIPESQAPLDAGTYDQMVGRLKDEGVQVYDRSSLANIRISEDQLEQIRKGVQVHEHGELGPTLVYSQHKTSGPPAPWRRRSRREFDDTGERVRGREVPDDRLSPLADL